MESQAAIVAFSALAQQTRLAVFRRLVVAGPKGLAAGELARELEIQPATLSFHLKELLHAELVRSKRFGRSIVYYPDFATIEAVLGYLTENCCQGSSCSSRKPKRSRSDEKVACQSRC